MPRDVTPTLVLLLASAVSLALAAVVAPEGFSRRALLTRGLTGLAALAVIAVVPSLDVMILVLLAIAVLHAGLEGTRDFSLHLRGPVVAVALMALALVFIRVQGPELLDRFAAVGLVAGISAAVGLLPYVHRLEPEGRAVEPPFMWLGFVGPVLATAVLLRSREYLPAQAGGYFGSMLIGLGLLNILWGTLAAWKTDRGDAAWQYSFMADWGLALCGFGITIADGQSAALLILLGIVLGRFPLMLASRAPTAGVEGDPPVNLLLAAMLAGAAPFAGFAARVLLLRGAAQSYWPLAVVLAIGMLLWLPASLRLGRSLGRQRGRRAFALGVVLAINAVVGLYPLPLLSLAGLL